MIFTSKIIRNLFYKNVICPLISSDYFLMKVELSHGNKSKLCDIIKVLLVGDAKLKRKEKSLRVCFWAEQIIYMNTAMVGGLMPALQRYNFEHTVCQPPLDHIKESLPDQT